MNLDSLSDSRVTLRTRIRTATREAILGAAAELLGRDSASQTRMEDIAARAGVAVGTVYNYFEDRTALVSALLETRTTTLLETLGEIAGGMTAKRTANAKASPADEFAQDLTRSRGLRRPADRRTSAGTTTRCDPDPARGWHA